MRRNNLDIAADILKAALDGARKTRIVYQANLNFDMVRDYLKRLIRQGMLEHKPPFFYTTEEGVNYLSRYEALQKTHPFFSE